ncbi:efflux RND transporter permease subunit [Phocaeicola sp. KGMB11183]|uniref:Efflux RND transporter permease subunit n=1 Tax=Phocaeicola acetigenes TaxID=3016083 RepID=A0ABT4PJD2_9BACT|nr:efflux RND transporter permease subunit [Phocaeicola sp. KGMB11183]MCZ8373161.1 efflux RND transporter permease subunit [Phocaeicola sp. KGMB11183]
MDNKKRNIVEWAMHYRQIIILVTCCLVAFGVYSLPQMQKNEFPDFTIRQGIVIAAAPGNTVDEMVEQVTKPLEDYIFTYKEVKKEKTFSTTRDGLVFIQVELVDELNNKDEFWSKFKHGIAAFKSQLPQNVLAVQVMDDFGDTSAMLLTMESKDKTYRELSDYMDNLKDRLRNVNSVGRLTVSGERKEQISIYLDPAKLTQYGLNEQMVASQLFAKGFVTTGGRIQTPDYILPVHVDKSYNTIYDVQQQIVYSDLDGNNIRLKDIARVVKEYPHADSYIKNNGTKCILLSIEMKKGKNIVKMGEDVNKVLEEFKKEIPSEVEMYHVTNQAQVVGDSVDNFLHELVIAIVAVVVVVMLLLPMRVALVAASTIPITIFISLGLFYAFGIELNTVTLAALIVTLGMIVDNSIVIIDSYLEKIGEGMSRWHASIYSATHFFKSIFSATLAISITFFPFLIVIPGMIHDFLLSFPWSILLILGISLLVAMLLVPFMQFWFIRKPVPHVKKGFSFMDVLQRFYNKILDACFAHPYITMCMGLGSIIVGVLLMGKLPQKLMPVADRNQFAIEIYLPTGTAVERTAVVADSIENVLRKDARVVSVTSFIGCSSPRFHTAYAPQIGGTNYSQLIVNTLGNEETVELLDEYSAKYTNAFPEARVRFKQISFSQAVYPVELRLSGQNLDSLKFVAGKYLALLRNMPEVELAQTNFSEPQTSMKVVLKEDEASRLGINNMQVETTLAMRYGNGVPLSNVWEGDYNIPITLKSEKADKADYSDLSDEMIPVMGGLGNVPLRQVAEVVPSVKDGQIVRRNGIYTITVMSDVRRDVNVTAFTASLKKKLATIPLPEGVTLAYGGDDEQDNENLPPIMSALAIAAFIIFFILLAHFKKISIALLIFLSMTLCLFGTAVGVLVQGVDFGMTCTLGIISLMGIIVRNGIIMIDYAEELRATEKLCVRDAIYHSAQRRMRPIFLTSAAASMGVIPMILGKSGLWMPMGTVICYGTLITMLFLLTVLPISYMLMFRGSTSKRAKMEAMEQM